MELPKKHDSMRLNHLSAIQDFTGFYIYIYNSKKIYCTPEKQNKKSTTSKRKMELRTKQRETENTQQRNITKDG